MSDITPPVGANPATGGVPAGFQANVPYATQQQWAQQGFTIQDGMTVDPNASGPGSANIWTPEGFVLGWTAGYGPGTSGGGTDTSGGTAGSTGTTSSTDPNSSANQDALAIINQELGTWGLSSLSNQAWGWITSGMGIDQIMFQIRQTPEYQAAFPGMALRQQNGLPAISEAQYLQFDDQAQQMARAAGLPAGFITSAEVGQLIGDDVSASELNDRITKGYVAAANSDPAVLQSLAAWGVPVGSLAAYYLDPTKALPMLEKQLAAAQVAGSAIRTGYGTIGQDVATNLQEIGVTQSAADKGFGDLAKQQQLFTPLPGQNGQTIGQGVQLGAEFENNAADQLAIQQVADAREAEFKGTSAYGTTSTGLSGTGQALRS